MARGVVSLVLGYVTSVVVDLAILIEVIILIFILLIFFGCIFRCSLKDIILMERVGTLYITDGDMCSISTMIRPKVSKSCQSIF